LRSLIKSACLVKSDHFAVRILSVLQTFESSESLLVTHILIWHSFQLYLSVAGSASPPVLFRRRDLYRPLRLHRLSTALSRPRPDPSAGSGSRPRSDLGVVPVSKPLMPRRPVTPSDKADSRSFSAQTRTGRSLSSLTSSASSVPVSGDRLARTMTNSSQSASTTRDSSRAESTAVNVNKLSRTLVKSLSADKAKPTLKVVTNEHRPTSTEPTVSKSQSTTNVKKPAKLKTDVAEKEVLKKEAKTLTSAKVSLCVFLCITSCDNF